MIAILCALLSGAGLYLSTQLGTIWWLAWLAPIPVLWLAYSGAPARQVFIACWAAFAIGMANMLPVYGGVFPISVLLVGLIVPGLIFGAAVLASRFVGRRLSPLAGVLAFAALWTAIDYLLAQGQNGTAISWANSQVGAPFLIQSASLFGSWAIDFVLTGFAAGLAMSLAIRRPAPAIAAALLFAANAGYGLWRIETAPPAPVVHVGLASYDHNFHRDLTRALTTYGAVATKLAGDHPELIVFPEANAAFTATDRNVAVAGLRQMQAQSGAAVVMGFDDESRAKPHNTALVAETNGTVRSYDKRHLVPGLEAWLTPGTGRFVMPDGTGVDICKDMDFPSTLRHDAARLHPTLLAVPAWDFEGDAWWHARLAILRGVENGFAVARSAKDGLMTLSDAYGRITAEARSSGAAPALLEGTLARGPGPTLYTRIGDVFAFACLMLSVLLLGAAAIRKPA